MKDKLKFYEKYKEYNVEPESIGFYNKIFGTDDEINLKFVFPNGYGASVIRHKGSYGYEKGLFELAVLKKYIIPNSYRLCYSTRITNDVIGYLTDDEVAKLLSRIKRLKKVED